MEWNRKGAIAPMVRRLCRLRSLFLVHVSHSQHSSGGSLGRRLGGKGPGDAGTRNRTVERNLGVLKGSQGPQGLTPGLVAGCMPGTPFNHPFFLRLSRRCPRVSCSSYHLHEHGSPISVSSNTGTMRRATSRDTNSPNGLSVALYSISSFNVTRIITADHNVHNISISPS